MAPSKTTASDVVWDLRRKEFLRICEKMRAGLKPTKSEDYRRNQFWLEFKARQLLAEREITDRRLVKEVEEKRKAERRARWEARCPTLVRTLSSLKRLVLMRKKPAAKLVATTKPAYNSWSMTTPRSAATTQRSWAPRTKPTNLSSYRSSPSVTPRVSPAYRTTFSAQSSYKPLSPRRRSQLSTPVRRTPTQCTTAQRTTAQRTPAQRATATSGHSQSFSNLHRPDPFEMALLLAILSNRS